MLNLRWSWHAETPRRSSRRSTRRPGSASGRRPGRAARRRSPPDRLARLAADRRFLRRLDDAADDLRRLPGRAALVPGERPGPSAAGAGGDRLLLARVRHHRGAAAVLRRAGHPGRRSPQGRPATWACRSSASACCTGTATSPSRCPPDGWQPERYPASDPNGLPLTLLRDGDRRPGADPASRWPTAQTLAAQVWMAQVGPGPAAAAGLLRRGERADAARGHRPALRRRQRAPAAPGAAARHRRRPGGPGLLRR